MLLNYFPESNNMRSTLAIAACATLAVVSASEFDADTYRCSICLSTVDAIKSTPRSSTENIPSFGAACSSFFGDDICSDSIFSNVNVDQLATNQEARDFCRQQKMCPIEPPAYQSSSAPQTLDYRVSKVVGSKGYDKLRLSVVSNETIDSPYLTYSQQFQYRWTDKFLSSGVITVPSGERTTISIAGTDIELYNPPLQSGVRGVIIGDPVSVCGRKDWIAIYFHRHHHQNLRVILELTLSYYFVF